MDVSAISAAYASLKLVRESLSLAISAKSDAQSRAKVHAAMEQITTLQDGLFHTQQQLLALQEENGALKHELSNIEAWGERAGQYKLVQSPGGAMVYQFSGEPARYACPNCYEGKRISILQDRHVVSGTWDCPGCSKSFRVSPYHPG